MPAPRTADDKFLALLARMPASMDTPDIAQALGWSRQNVQLVASRLVREERVVRIDGERNAANGRPPCAYALPGAVPTMAIARHAPLAHDTVVVTPSGEEARVTDPRRHPFLEIEYITGPERFQRTTLHVALLRAFQPGRERPAPVRIAAKEAA